MAAAASLGTSRTKTGTDSKPAKCEARKRRSPAMISYLPACSPSVSCRTKIGCMMPCALIDSASSYKAPSSMRVRGWYMPGTICVSLSWVGTPVSAAMLDAGASCTLGPSSASSPRPKPLGFLVTMVIPSTNFLTAHGLQANRPMMSRR